MNTIAVAIFASGAGSTAEAFIRACHASPDNPCETKVVICNTPGAGIFDRIALLNQEFDMNIQTTLINGHNHPAASNEPVERGKQTIAEQAAIIEMLDAHHIDIVVLMGYMKHVGPVLTEKYGWLSSYQSIYQARMLNTHPGLLPLTQGLSGVNVQKKVLSEHASQAGQTLHLVSATYDDGPTIAEHRLTVAPGETADELFARVQKLEKAHIAADVARFAAEQQVYRREQ